ncbi:MAG TPA: ATP-binding protein [Blastocatellia bacterium]|nr:ATP-binding protein [Blastocatellia bacterium]
MPFDFDTPKTFFEKATKAVDWIVEEIVRQRNWRSLLVLLDVILFLAFNPVKWPFPNLLSFFPRLAQFGWYSPVFWSLIGVIFVIAVIVAARAKRKPGERPESKLGAIKGLLPFGYEDAEVFSHLQRDQNLKECIQAIGDEQWRFGVLSGESGTGKTSFLQAGLWPEMERRKFRCVYVKFSDLDPFESVKRAGLKHLSLADGATEAADFLGLLRAAAEQDRTPIILLFDQFEQFFVHRKRKKDREPFVQALAQWFAETQSLPVKILICIRGDFLDRLNELQKAMRYSLSPTQSFRLERFEPDQATEVFCFLAEKDGLEYDRKFISEMTRQELADTEDGLISPVDIQVLARMIERQTARGGRAFDRTTFQKLGGVEGLLERYLTIALEPLGTQSRRQAAIKVLLALTDLERNARAGALTGEGRVDRRKPAAVQIAVRCPRDSDGNRNHWVGRVEQQHVANLFNQ